METINILDVTVIEPRLKHPTIFNNFDLLSDNECFIIHNDHDPKPLYYQLIAERGNTFTWEYLENGPEQWKVKIGKSGNTTEETIGETVAKDYRKAQVFKKFGIDFCCGGKKTLTEVCNTKGIDAQVVKQELAAAEKSNNTAENFGEWDTDFLVEYIINIHHKYVKENTPFLLELSKKVGSVHGASHPETLDVAIAFARVAEDLSLHMVKEENILFPYIKELIHGEKNGSGLPPTGFGGVKNPIQIMEMEHEQAGEDFEIIRKLTNNYTLPEGACASYTILYKKLEEFENDLHRHVHLENNILFPKALQLENGLK